MQKLGCYRNGGGEHVIRAGELRPFFKSHVEHENIFHRSALGQPCAQLAESGHQPVIVPEHCSGGNAYSLLTVVGGVGVDTALTLV